MTHPLTLYIIAAEPSGDYLGAKLAHALKQLDPTIKIYGIGGDHMRQNGIDSPINIMPLATMGLDFLGRLPTITRSLKTAGQHINTIKPDGVITIDAPDFTKRLMKNKPYPWIHFVAPSVWAWRAGRAKKLAKRLDHLLTLLPFEPPYFTKHGLSCDFVGHPILDSGADKGDPKIFYKWAQADATTNFICLLPGSRWGEIHRHLAIFGQTCTKLPHLAPIIITLPQWSDKIKDLTASWPIPPLLVPQSHKYHAMKASTVALAASGTVTLELTLAGVPAVVAYKISPLAAFIARRCLTIKWASLVNILLDKPVIEEYIQNKCQPHNLAEALGRAISNKDTMIADYTKALSRLTPPLNLGQTPSEAAARSVLRFLDTL